jgi:histone-lysine N-methyltransferase SETMAR
MARQFRNETREELILHADIARPHTAKSGIEFCAKLGLKVTPHPPYSPDLAPSDYCLFGYMKDELKSLLFPSALHFHCVIKLSLHGHHVE